MTFESDEDERAWVAFVCAAWPNANADSIDGNAICDSAAQWADGMLSRLRKPSKPTEGPFR